MPLAAAANNSVEALQDARSAVVHMEVPATPKSSVSHVSAHRHTSSPALSRRVSTTSLGSATQPVAARARTAASAGPKLSFAQRHPKFIKGAKNTALYALLGLSALALPGIPFGLFYFMLASGTAAQKEMYRADMEEAIKNRDPETQKKARELFEIAAGPPSEEGEKAVADLDALLGHWTDGHSNGLAPGK